jgi:hypothetical protein
LARRITYVNLQTHWWDASQLYGDDRATLAKLRTGSGGQLRTEQVGGQETLSLDPTTGIDLTGFTDNWWVGLSLLHTLFTLEHNAVCDRLHAAYPAWGDEQLFQTARLVNAALMAKIHTVEWTPAILTHPAIKIALNANWWGLAGESVKRVFGRLSNSESLSGIVGSPVDHHGADYALTEEFVAVYRLHPLMPDTFTLRSLAGGKAVKDYPMVDLTGSGARAPLNEGATLADLFYSFGRAHPGAIRLHNYPEFLRDFKRQSNGERIDLATIDILRDRERGVPRYTKFRELLHLPPVRTFEELTDNPEWREQLRAVYQNDIDRVDLMVGMYAEPLPEGFAFSDTAFRVFILMASRRLKSNRFLTDDFTPQVYSQEGLDWVAANTMSSILLRHYPQLSPALRQVPNAFAPWRDLSATPASQAADRGPG